MEPKKLTTSWQTFPLRFFSSLKRGLFGPREISILDTKIANTESPLRSEILTREGLAEHARMLADQHRVGMFRWGPQLLYRRFEENRRILEETHLQLSEAAQEKEFLTSGAEWLLDNYHIIQDQVRDIRRNFPSGYSRSLPKLTEGEYRDYPRVYHLALEAISHTDATVDAELLTHFIEAYQSRSELSSGELWAFPIMLRFALIENLRRLAVSIIEGNIRRKNAEKMVEEILAPELKSSTDLLLVLATKLKENPDILIPGTVTLMRRLQVQGPKAQLTLQWLEARLREQGHDPEELARFQAHSQAATQISIGNTFTSLRSIGAMDWQDWFENVSFVHRDLLSDPSGFYPGCDFTTRDHYRRSVERLARRLKISESKIAIHVLRLAEQVKQKVISEKGEILGPDIRFSHVGYYLVGKGFSALQKEIGCRPTLAELRDRFFTRHAFLFYMFTISIVCFALCIGFFNLILGVGGNVFQSTLGVIVFFIPLTEVAINIVQWVSTRFISPVHLPKLDLEFGVPDQSRTVVAVQGIFFDKISLTSAIERMEVRFLGNDDPNIFFALLADLPDADSETTPQDQEMIELSEKLISLLNERHFPNENGRFFLLFRRRLWNASENKFMGWERKRGKVAEFNRFILGDETTTLSVRIGDPQLLRTAKYVITLDSDSRLPQGVAKKLIGTITHPLNRPVFNPKTNVVVEGYGIVQPRVGATLLSSRATRFSILFSGHAGLDPYTQTVSDVYQDLFHEGSFVGKGIYDVETFERALHNRAPENTLLSHDLFEGNLARVALATDIEIFDDFPSRYQTFARRQHRWVRGDWQLLPWISRRVPDGNGQLYKTPFSPLGSWKLLDNLRRSLVVPACFLLLCLGFTVLPSAPLLWIFVIVAAVAFPVFSNFANSLAIPFKKNFFISYFRILSRDFFKPCGQAIFTISLIPYQTYLMLHAVSITLYRVFVSRKNLLEWQVAYYVERNWRRDNLGFLEDLAPGIFLTFFLTTLIAIAEPEHLPSASPILILWALSPLLMLWLNKPIKQKHSKISAPDRNYLLDIGWKTWTYFDELMNVENNYLIPDNIQLEPNCVVAERTSPTNISLSILSLISAYDLGFLSQVSLIQRLEKTFETLNKLERVHGHFLNWYQTKTLESLQPRYVSAVDSGNLAGHLIAARNAFAQFPKAPLFADSYWEHLRRRTIQLTSYKSIRDTHVKDLLNELRRLLADQVFGIPDIYKRLLSLGVFSEKIRIQLENFPNDPEALADLMKFRFELEELTQTKQLLEWCPLFAEFLSNEDKLLESVAEKNREEIQILFRRTTRLLQNSSPSLSLLKDLIQNLEFLCKKISASSRSSSSEELNPNYLLEKLKLTGNKIDLLLSSLKYLEYQSSDIIEEMDLGFLYDPKKRLFAIGYHVDSGRKDNSYYDLLASESRLGSFVAIATGQVPQKHWFALGRSLVDSLGGTALVSWTATMFEYLMPILVMRDYQGTLLSDTYRAVVLCQQRYAKKNNVPWGFSESAYSAVDFEKTYQYKAFGVPVLGLKRGLAEDIVVSPYSTFLALMIDSASSIRNMKRLEKDGMCGKYGFYEAIDYTPERLSSDETSHIIRSFLAHHQGMSLVSINNVLHQGIMQNRFHADPYIRATDLLLHERFPELLQPLEPIQVASEFSLRKLNGEEQQVSKCEQIFTPHTHHPQTRVLSNGHYTILMDNAGNGFSIADREIALTRWREDGVVGQYGTYIFIRDLDDGHLWSVAYQPTKVDPEYYEVIFNPDKIEFKRRDFGIYLHTEITVSPEDNVEVRQVTLTNISSRRRNLEITSYGEVALARKNADLAHPAFAKMFVESEYEEELEALIFERRPRSKNDERLFLMHTLAMKTVFGKTQFETSRFRFLGRGKSLSSPEIFSEKINRPDSGSLGSVFDPIFSLRTRVVLEEGETTSAVFSTGMARSREEILTLAGHYHDRHVTTRAFEMAWSQSNIELRHEQFSIRQTHAFQRLVTAILYNIEEVRGETKSIISNRLSQSGLWRFSVSGDLPIVLLKINDPAQMRLVREVLLAHQYIRMLGINFDLVILNEFPGGYFQDFQEELELTVRSGYFGSLIDQKGGVYLRTVVQLLKEELTLLEAIARVVLVGAKGDLSTQLKFIEKSEKLPPRRRIFSKSNRELVRPETPKVKEEYEFFNGLGGFVNKGKAYQIELDSQTGEEMSELPPLPWSNVIANPDFGFLVTESGAGYTWSENSRENRITPWSNDPVADPLGEVIYIHDIEQGSYWCPTPRPLPLQQKCSVAHAFGRSEFKTKEQGIDSILTISGSPTEKVKWWHLNLTNNTQSERRLEVYLYLEWVLGINRDESARHLVSDFNEEGNFLSVTNHYNNEFSGRVVHAGSNLNIKDYTTSRHEFIGRNRDVSAPQALEARAVEKGVLLNPSSLFSASQAGVKLSKKVGAGFDSCGVLQVEINLAPGQQREMIFYLSEADSLDDAKRNSPRFRSLDTRATELEKTNASWNSVLSTVQVKTPDRAFDLLTNGWLLYQNLSCRINGRSSFYQSGGAIGFRDQLQDVMALLYSRPDIARAQILLHASRQFPEGDVQHWWHPPTGRGVRTKISDDYLWLPYVVSRYVEVTGDKTILNEPVTFIDGPNLENFQMESYLLPQVSERSASLYEHCTLALDRALVFGEHQLPLIGGGDWNDGMNEIGKEGKGESVWLAWFLSDCLQKFAKLARANEDQEHAELYKTKSLELVQAIDEEAWDGDWYRRAYFDDGTPVGSKESGECKIDSISQSWSVIAGGGDSSRSFQAMDSARRELVNKKEKLILLLTPPFDSGNLEPGYIKGYLPGVRENGGQYNHAACWLTMATVLQGKGKIAFELFSMINPINLTADRSGVKRYQGEPYVLCGDVYSTPGHLGRAGWSWYTGSSGLMYQVAVENILGLKVFGNYFTVEPCVPPTWKSFFITYQRGNTRYEIEIENPNGVEHGVTAIKEDGKETKDKKIFFKNEPELAEKVVKVTVLMG